MSEKSFQLEPAQALRKPARRGFGWPLLLALSALFLAGCLIAARAAKPAAPPETRTEAASAAFVQLIPEQAGRPVAVSIMQGEAGFTLLEEGGVYRFEGEEAELAPQAAGELLSCGESILARRRLEGDSSEYGMDAPALSARFVYANHPDVVLLLGGPVPTGEGWYAAIEGDPSVYIVNNALARALSVSRQSLYALPDLSERFTAQTLEKVTIERPGAETIAIARVTRANPFNTMVELTRPIQYPANSERAAEVYLALEKIQPTGIADLQGTDEAWGLDKPLAVLTLEDHGTTRLAIGSAGDTCTLRIDDKSAVYTLGADTLSFLDSLTVPWLAEQLPGLVMLSQVSAMDVQAGEKTLHFDVDQSAKTYLLEGKPLSEEAFLPVYQQMIGLLIERYIPEPQGEGAPRLKLDYTFKDGSRWSLTIAEYDDSFDLIVRDQCAHFLISRSKTDAVIQSILGLVGRGDAGALPQTPAGG